MKGILIMKKIIYVLMICLFLSACSSKKLTSSSQLKIVVASDLHYFLKDYYKECEWFEESMLYGDGKMVTYADEIMEAFIERVKEIKPHLVILTGDLSFNGEVGSHKELAKKLKVLKDDGINVAVIPGNHDVDNILTKGYGKDDYFEVENVDAKTFQEIYKDLGYDLAVKKHKDSLSYRIDLNEDYSLLMMDSNHHALTGGLDTGGVFTESTMQWLQEELKDIEKSQKIPIVAMHHNLTDHSEMLNVGYTIQDHEKIVSLFKQYHVPFVLSGHIHCQNIKEVQGIYDIASSSLLDAPLQFGIINLNKNEMNYHTESLVISEDANEYFMKVSSNRFEDSFLKIEDEEVRKQMKEVMVKANLYYFSGNIADHIDELKNMQGYQYFEKDEGKLLSFYKEYLDSMMKEDMNHQKLYLQFQEE